MFHFSFKTINIELRILLLRFIILIILFTLCPIYCVSRRVGLVLSGGSAKGVAHIGVIKALEEKGIPIDYIAGTSMGAIIASLYAMGYSPDDMHDFVLKDEFVNVVSTKMPDEYMYYFKGQIGRAHV